MYHYVKPHIYTVLLNNLNILLHVTRTLSVNIYLYKVPIGTKNMVKNTNQALIINLTVTEDLLCLLPY